VDPSYTIEELMEEVHDLQVLTVFVEGGAQLHQSFLDSGLWDEARVFTGKMRFSQGVKAPEIHREPAERLVFRDTVVELYQNFGSADA
jgi:diaminohydroxyphosphoribosylaminopyrimidine deaminase/5-amino-6-(5-phosphoribosylamino)uracil reductase